MSDAVTAVRPHYPYEARRSRITGSGIAVFKVDSSTGEVTEVRMAISTGSALLDRAALHAFRQWRFPKKSPPLLKTPVTFTVLEGRPTTDFRVRSKNMDNVLAEFLGKGTVAHGPIPEYPRSVAWSKRSGKGIFELHVRKDGTVEQVKILKSSGDATFDRVAVRTLGKWRLRRGPLVIELPLSFSLTRNNYSVQVAR